MGIVLLIVSGIALMLGSVGSWVHVTGSVGGVAALHVSVNGMDPAISTLISVNGYVTFIGGIVLLVFGGLALNYDDPFLAGPHPFVAAADHGVRHLRHVPDRAEDLAGHHIRGLQLSASARV